MGIAVGLFVVTSSSAESLSLRGDWKFDEGSGTTAADSSANGNDGQVNNGSWVMGVDGTALQFTGASNSFVEIANAAELTPTTHLLIDVWFMPTSYPMPFNAVLFKGDLQQTGCFGERSYALWVRSDGGLEFSSTPEGSPCQVFYTTQPVVTLNQWSHVMVDVDTQAGMVRVWHNGTLVLSSTYPNQAIRVGDSPLRIGGTIVSLGDQGNFAGAIDEVRILGLGPDIKPTRTPTVTATATPCPDFDADTACDGVDADDDGDGCPDVRELVTGFGAQNSGGNRDPLNPYDYFNPTHDGENRIDDILAVVYQYYKDAGNPAYNADTDRTLVGPNLWNTGPPNGLQRVDDILNIVHQYHHDCA